MMRVWLIDKLIDFTDMSTRPGLFYAPRLGNPVRCMFLTNIFWVIVSEDFFVHGPIEYEWFLHRFGLSMVPKQVLPLRASVDLEVRIIKE